MNREANALQRCIGMALRGLHATCVRVFPAAFRDRHRDALHETFADALEGARRRAGSSGMLATGAAELADTLARAAQARRPKTVPRSSRTDALYTDIRYAVRGMRNRHAVSGILALALGIGATTAVFGVVDAVLLRDLPYPEPDRLMRIGVQRPGSTALSTLSPPLYEALGRAGSFEATAASHSRFVTLTGVGRPQRVLSAFVSHGFFDLLGGSASHGRLLSPDDDRPGGTPVAVLSDAAWRTTFGADPAVIGNVVTLDGSPFTIVGVLADGFVVPEGNRLSGSTLIWLPLGQSDLMAEPGLSFLDAFARLGPRVRADVAATEVDGLGRALGTELGLSPRIYETLRTTPLQGETVGKIGETLWPLLGAVALLLVIACSNVANLLLTRISERNLEMSLRAAIGASRGRSARLLLIESTLLAGAGGAAGALIAYTSVAALRAFRPAAIPRLAEISVDPRVLMFAAGLSGLTGIVVGLLPAVAVRRLDPGAALRSGFRGSTAGRRQSHLSRALIVAQTAIALVLVVAAGLLTNSFARLYAVDVGFDTEQTLRMQVSLGDLLDGSDEMQVARLSFFGKLLDDVAAIPAVDGAWLTTGSPFSTGGWYSVVNAVGREPGAVGGPGAEESAYRHQISAGRLRGMGLRILAGREIDDRDRRHSAPVVVVNKALADRYWPDGDALGAQVVIGGDANETPRTVVGIVSNARYRELDEDGELHIYLPYEQFPAYSMDVVARYAGDPAPVAARMREAVWALDDELAINDLQTTRALVYADLVEPGFYTWLLGSFALVAVALASVGIYGSIAEATTMRTREIGVRIAIGARPGQAILMMLRSAAITTALGIGIGLICAAATTRYLASFLFEVQAGDPATYATAGGLFAVVSFLAAYVPARRAARVEPVAALRSD